MGESSIYLFVAIVPVTMDALFKYWIFKGLNRQSPAAAVTLRCEKLCRRKRACSASAVLRASRPRDAQHSSSRPGVWHCLTMALPTVSVLQIHGPALRAAWPAGHMCVCGITLPRVLLTVMAGPLHQNNGVECSCCHIASPERGC